MERVLLPLSKWSLLTQVTLDIRVLDFVLAHVPQADVSSGSAEKSLMVEANQRMIWTTPNFQRKHVPKTEGK